ncbi:MAG: dephospho-CoA kinase [Clostridia bacterium]|nr:dephospho-CoA kinase [Clostridia bacterium]
MLVIGLTGPSGAGKGTVADLLREYGLSVIDADRVYHALLIPPSPCLDALCKRFGKGILTADGTLDRKMLGGLVFSDPAALQDLNSIAHRFVMDKIRAQLRQLEANGHRAAVIDAPQLFEAGADKDCTAVIAVLADENLRVERIVRRDGIPAQAALQRIRAQKEESFFRTHSNYIIENNGTAEELRPQVRQILMETGVLPE